MWDTTALPVTEPRSVAEPSPQSTETSLTALPLDGTVTAIVNAVGSPALGGGAGAAGGVMTIVGAAAMLTVTVADA